MISVFLSLSLSLTHSLTLSLSPSLLDCIYSRIVPSTERSYVLDMVLLVTHYVKPTYSLHLLTEDQTHVIFSNVATLLEVCFFPVFPVSSSKFSLSLLLVSLFSLSLSLKVHTNIVKEFGEEPTFKSVIEAYQNACATLIREYGIFATTYSSALDLLDSPKLSKDFVTFCARSRMNPANKGLSLGNH
jgi:hypothetical protein